MRVTSYSAAMGRSVLGNLVRTQTIPRTVGVEGLGLHTTGRFSWRTEYQAPRNVCSGPVLFTLSIIRGSATHIDFSVLRS